MRDTARAMFCGQEALQAQALNLGNLLRETRHLEARSFYWPDLLSIATASVFSGIDVSPENTTFSLRLADCALKEGEGT